MSKFVYSIVSADRTQFFGGSSKLVNEYPDASKFSSVKLAFMFAKDFAIKHPEQMPTRLDVVKNFGMDNAKVVRSVYRQETLKF